MNGDGSRSAWRTVRAVAAKDARELIRDRRTLFVNLVLPVLLYPVLALLALQLQPLASPDRSDVPAVAVLPGGQPVAEELTFLGDTASPSLEALRRAELDTATRSRLIGVMRAARRAEGPDALQPVLQAMRDAEVAAAIIGAGPLAQSDDSATPTAASDTTSAGVDSPTAQIHVWYDNAHPLHATVRSQMDVALEDFQSATWHQRLVDRGVEAEVLEPVPVATHEIASKGEQARTGLATIIPFLIMMIAISGAFYPAVDGIAGERERGTLETLLVWPCDRRHLFLAKLLVVIMAALVSVVLNLCSLAVTGAIATNALGAAGAELGAGLLVGWQTVLATLILLTPVTVTVATLALALAGVARSFKEAQNYLTPLILLVTVPAAMILFMPTVKPSIALDLVPVVGPLVVLKQALQQDGPAWGHVALACGSSLVLAWIVVQWAARLLDSEHFLYPGIHGGGWKAWAGRPAGQQEPVPGGIAAILIFIVAFAAFFLTSVLAMPDPATAEVPDVVIGSMAALILGIGLPAVLLVGLAGFDLAATLRLYNPGVRNVVYALLLVPCAMMLSAGLGFAQTAFMPEQPPEQLRMLEDLINTVLQDGGILIALVAMALTPGICEELLCRGSLLSGLERGVGRRSAIIVSAFLFAALHMSPYRFVPQMVLGIVLAVLTIRSGSIVPAMIVHFGHNGLVLVVAAVTGATQTGEEGGDGLGALASVPEEPSWSSGLVIAAVAGALCILLLRSLRPADPGPRGDALPTSDEQV